MGMNPSQANMAPASQGFPQATSGIAGNTGIRPGIPASKSLLSPTVSIPPPQMVAPNVFHHTQPVYYPLQTPTTPIQNYQTNYYNTNYPGSSTSAAYRPVYTPAQTFPKYPQTYPANYQNRSLQQPVRPLGTPQQATQAQIPQQMPRQATQAQPPQQQTQPQPVSPNPPASPTPPAPPASGPGLDKETITRLNAQLNNINESIRATAGGDFLKALGQSPAASQDPHLKPYINAMLTKILKDPSPIIREDALIAYEAGVAPPPDEYALAELRKLSQGHALFDIESGSAQGILDKFANPDLQSTVQASIPTDKQVQPALAVPPSPLAPVQAAQTPAMPSQSPAIPQQRTAPVIQALQPLPQQPAGQRLNLVSTPSQQGGRRYG